MTEATNATLGNEPALSDGCLLSYLNSRAFDAASFPRQWLIEHILVQNQPGILGGARKSLKTSLALDMAISLGSGTPFLGRWRVPDKKRVAVFSGESGEATLQETAKRIWGTHGVELPQCDVLWLFKLPHLTSDKDLSKLSRFIREKQVKVVFIDPLYLCLLGPGSSNAAGNLFEMGPILKRGADACLDAGATPEFIHHATKGSRKGGNPQRQPDLDDLAWSGMAEFARQWILISRREEYQPGSGEHRLLLSVGGSAGHSGSWDLKIQEGQVNDQFEGRTWDVRIEGDSARAATERDGSSRPTAVSSTPASTPRKGGRQKGLLNAEITRFGN